MAEKFRIRDTAALRQAVASVLAALLFLGPTIATDAQTTPTPQPESSHVDDHVLVRISPGVSAQSALTAASRPLFGRWHRIPVPPGRDAREMVAALADNPRVEMAVLDPVVQLDPVDPVALDASAAAAPDDPYYSLQWHFPPVQLEEAWDRATGRDVVVALVDTGISQGGEDLACRSFVHPYNALTNSTALSASTDDHGHGTHVAGTIAQCTGNGVGVAGVAIDAALMPVKVLDATGAGTISTIAAGVDWARTHGADVINLSLGASCASPWPDCSEPILNEAIEAAAAEGIVIVAAAGNDATGVVGHPANHPDVIAVAAVDYNLELAHYSTHGSDLDVVAPGGDTRFDLNGDTVVDGVVQETFTPPEKWAYYAFQGTSMATPHVTGAAALLRSAFPAVDRTAIGESLLQSARDLGPPGIDPSYGHGLIQMSDAIDYLLATDSSAPTWPAGATLSVAGAGGGHITVSWPQATDDLGVVAYRLFVDENVVETLTRGETSATLTDLADGPHVVAVRAYDTAGKRSPDLAAPATHDTTPPTWPSGARLEVSGYGAGTLGVKWPAATDDTGVTEYRLRLGGEDVLTTAAQQGSVPGVEPDTAYGLEVLARDQAGNWSEPLSETVSTPGIFSDTSGSVFVDDILSLAARGVTRGCNPPENDRFCPDDPVTRGQMAAFLTRALGLRETGPSFADATDHVFAADITRIAAADITRGCNPPDNDRFCPDDPVTRGQMAAFLARALQLPGSTTDSFHDDDTSVFQAEIEALAASGVTRGCNPPDNDRFCPDEPVTRGQMAAFLTRALTP